MDLRFSDHPSFHKATLGMVAGSALFGLALHPLTALAPLAGGLLGIAAGASIAHGKTMIRMLAACVAVAAMFVLPATWGSLAVVAAVMALAVATAELRGVAGALAVCLSAATTMLGMWSALRFGHARETQSWPPIAQSVIAAASFGMIGALAMIPRHLLLVLDPVAAAMRKLPAKLDPEVRALCDRSYAIWNQSHAKLDDSNRALVQDGVLKALDVAAKSVGIDATGANEEILAQRITELDAKIAAATDTEAKTQYQAARAAIDDQRKYRDRIHAGKDRMLARMHNHVAALEKFQLAAASLTATHTGPLKQLEEASSDVAASGDALAELEMA